MGVYFENSRNARIERAGFRFAHTQHATKKMTRSSEGQRPQNVHCTITESSRIPCALWPSHDVPMQKVLLGLLETSYNAPTKNPVELYIAPILSITLLVLSFIPCRLYLFRRWPAAATVYEDVLLLLVILWLKKPLNTAQQRHNLKS